VVGTNTTALAVRRRCRLMMPTHTITVQCNLYCHAMLQSVVLDCKNDNHSNDEHPAYNPNNGTN